MNLKNTMRKLSRKKLKRLILLELKKMAPFKSYDYPNIDTKAKDDIIGHT